MALSVKFTLMALSVEFTLMALSVEFTQVALSVEFTLMALSVEFTLMALCRTHPDGLVEDLAALLDRHQVLLLQVAGAVDVARPVALVRVGGIDDVDELTRVKVIHLQQIQQSSS